MSVVDQISAALGATGVHRGLPAEGPFLVMLHGLGVADGTSLALGGNLA